MKNSFIQNALKAIKNIFMTANGFDALSRFLLQSGALILLLGFIFSNKWIAWLGFAVILYFYIRTFSKDKQKFNRQNSQFLRRKQNFLGFFTGWKRKMQNWQNKFQQRKVYRFYKCPNCGQKVRIPKGKGKVAITCPKCKNKFVKKS